MRLFLCVSLAPLACLPPTASDAKVSNKDTERGCFYIESPVGIQQSFATLLQEVEHLMSLPAQIHAMVQQGVPWWQIIYTGIMSTDAVLMIEVRTSISFTPHLSSAPCFQSSRPVLLASWIYHPTWGRHEVVDARRSHAFVLS